MEIKSDKDNRVYGGGKKWAAGGVNEANLPNALIYCRPEVQLRVMCVLSPVVHFMMPFMMRNNTKCLFLGVFFFLKSATQEEISNQPCELWPQNRNMA